MVVNANAGEAFLGGGSNANSFSQLRSNVAYLFSLPLNSVFLPEEQPLVAGSDDLGIEVRHVRERSFELTASDATTTCGVIGRRFCRIHRTGASTDQFSSVLMAPSPRLFSKAIWHLRIILQVRPTSFGKT